MVEDGEQAVDGSTAPCVLDIIAVAVNEDVGKLVLRPHGGNPRLRDIRHQGAHGAGGFMRAVVGGTHPRLGEAVAAIVVLAHQTGHREDEWQFVAVGQRVDI